QVLDAGFGQQSTGRVGIVRVRVGEVGGRETHRRRDRRDAGDGHAAQELVDDQLLVDGVRDGLAHLRVVQLRVGDVEAGLDAARTEERVGDDVLVGFEGGEVVLRDVEEDVAPTRAQLDQLGRDLRDDAVDHFGDG